ncbi:Pyridine nucleotide-disulfide oxidoreductase, NAD-binding domain protein [Metarhizium brunneum]
MESPAARGSELKSTPAALAMYMKRATAGVFSFSKPRLSCPPPTLPLSSSRFHGPPAAMLAKLGLYARAFGYILVVLGQELSYLFNRALVRRRAQFSGSTPADGRDRTIVIVGASFAGHHVARLVAGQLPPRSRYRVVVVEPNSHFQFTWVLPRFCVVKGHEHKAFIPYGKYVECLPGVLEWVQDRAASVDGTHVRLEKSGESIRYDYLVVATGSGVRTGLPSRVNAAEKRVGVALLRGIQSGIEAARTVVVVGGGAAGVEVAADAKDLYPDKKIVLVHSRAAVMHRFGKRLQDEALEGLTRLGVEVVLEDRVVDEDSAAKKVTLRSGREIPCDLFLNCTGQSPCSELLSSLSPQSISTNGYIKVKPTLQIADDECPNVYACGEVADTETPCPNARSAMRQAATVAKNILSVVDGKQPKHVYRHHWVDTFIKLTLGLDRSATFIGDGHSDLMFKSRDKDVTLMVKSTWARMGLKPFEDEYDEDDSGAKVKA